MTWELAMIYGMNIVVNSMLMFITTVLLIEFFLLITGIKNFRAKMLCRLIPIIKLPLDLFLYNFGSWALMQNIDPLHCEKGSRMLSIGFSWFMPSSNWHTWFYAPPLAINFQTRGPNNSTYGIGDILALKLDSFWVTAVVCCFIILSILILAKKISSLYQQRKVLKTIINQASPLSNNIDNPQLAKQINKSKTQIVTSDKISSPCSYSLIKHIILIPQGLIKLLSKNEYETIIAHEITHIRWHDGFIKLLLEIINCLFWWIPQKWYTALISNNQELDCDRKINDYDLPTSCLASAIVKTIKSTRTPPLPSTIGFNSSSNTTKRLKKLLSKTKREKPWLALIKISMVTILTSSLLFGKIWIF